MIYPIFDSIVKNIESGLSERSILIDAFRTWNEPAINATGLELGVEMDERSKTLTDMSINMDWDKFREIKMARQLKGMEEHPFLKEKVGTLTNVKAAIDVEVMWVLNEKSILDQFDESNFPKRIESASNWMERINERASFLLKMDDVMTRWHVELEGDMNGRYVSKMCLISYFQYTLDGCTTVNDVHDYISEKLKNILSITRRLIVLSEETLPQVA